MPQEIESCVNKLLSKWKSDPSSQPKLKDGQDLKSAAFGICQSTLKAEKEQDAILLEGLGPALIAAAVTAKPHLRQRGREVKIIERDGKELVEVPLLGPGIYKHPHGKLVFNQAFFERMIKNHRDKVTDYNVHLDFRHKDTQGALAFLDTDDGGFLEIKDGWLTAYGPLVDEEAKKIINSRKWRYASAEFYKDYESNLVQRLSADDLDEVTHDELLAEATEVTMPKVIEFGNVKITLEEADGGAFTMDAKAFKALTDQIAATQKADGDKDAKVTALETEVKDAKTQIKKLEDQVKKLTPDPEPEIPEAYRLRLEELESETKLMREQRLREQIVYTMEKARSYVDDKGRAHAPALLDLCRKGLALEALPNGDGEPIKLEAETDEGYVKYFRNFIRVLLETVPGQMPKEPQTEGSEIRLEAGKETHFTEDEMKEELKNFESF